MHLEKFHFLVLGILVLLQAKIPENTSVTCAFVTVCFFRNFGLCSQGDNHPKEEDVEKVAIILRKI
jgi:hypothetical protein